MSWIWSDLAVLAPGLFAVAVLFLVSIVSLLTWRSYRKEHDAVSEDAPVRRA